MVAWGLHLLGRNDLIPQNVQGHLELSPEQFKDGVYPHVGFSSFIYLVTCLVFLLHSLAYAVVMMSVSIYLCAYSVPHLVVALGIVLMYLRQCQKLNLQPKQELSTELCSLILINSSLLNCQEFPTSPAHPTREKRICPIMELWP